jgi:phosphate transport system substrate-binding protein
LELSGTDEVISATGSTPGAIGYADLGAAERHATTVRTVEIDGEPATSGLVQSGVYQFWAIERMYTRASPDMLSTSFISYVTDHVNRSVRNDDTFVRISDFQDGVLASHE